MEEYKFLNRLSLVRDFSGFVTGWLVLMWVWAYELWNLLDALPLSLSVATFTYILAIMFLEPRYKTKLLKYEEAYDGMSLLFGDLTFAVMESNKKIADVTMEKLKTHIEDVT